MIWIGCIALLLLGLWIFAGGCILVGMSWTPYPLHKRTFEIWLALTAWAIGILLVCAAIHYMPFDVVMTG